MHEQLKILVNLLLISVTKTNSGELSPSTLFCKLVSLTEYRRGISSELAERFLNPMLVRLRTTLIFS